MVAVPSHDPTNGELGSVATCAAGHVTAACIAGVAYGGNGTALAWAATPAGAPPVSAGPAPVVASWTTW